MTENIERKFDGLEIGKQFIDFFYNSWFTNPDTLNNVITYHSKLKCNNITFIGDNIILALKNIINTGIKLTNCRYELLDSRSRQIYILVSGSVIKDESNSSFSQTFLLSYVGDKKDRQWIIMNSLLII